MKLVSLAAVALLVTGSFVGGCAQPRKTEVAPSSPISPEALAGLREEFNRNDPNVRLASVVEVLATEDYLRLGDASATDFPVGTSVGILDSNRNLVSSGEVVRADDGRIDVRFSQTGARRPMVGDVGIRY